MAVKVSTTQNKNHDSRDKHNTKLPTKKKSKKKAETGQAHGQGFCSTRVAGRNSVERKK
eukprot:m.11773 g.11773  ORF g.11773 m.11773 type:complete len:59 (+) comp8974_c0_seq1:118-294(+)